MRPRINLNRNKPRPIYNAYNADDSLERVEVARKLLRVKRH